MAQGDVDGVHEAVHTSILTAIIGGIILIFVGVLLAKPLLELMGTPEDVIDLSVFVYAHLLCRYAGIYAV